MDILSELSGAQKLWASGGVLLLLSFFSGAISFAAWAASIEGIDLRSKGSGNLGTTNVWRVMGWKWGLIVFVLDAAKGAIPTYVAMLYLENPWWHVAVALMAVLGHMFSPFLKGGGGRGVATTLGAILVLIPQAFIVVFGLGVILVAITRMVSVASITGAVLLPILMHYLGAPTPYFLGITGLCIGVLIRHRANIVRIIQGKENRVF